jgi:hypothetical protein
MRTGGGCGVGSGFGNVHAFAGRRRVVKMEDVGNRVHSLKDLTWEYRAWCGMVQVARWGEG